MEQALKQSYDWRKAHPRATFREIEGEVEARLAAVRQGLIEELADQSASSDLAEAAETERPLCEHCGGRLEARGRRGREVMTLRGERVRLRRSYAVCSQCGAGLFPPG